MEITTSTNNKAKKSKKSKNTTSEVTSNNQNAFNFTWGNSTSTVKAKAFKKRQKDGNKNTETSAIIKSIKKKDNFSSTNANIQQKRKKGKPEKNTETSAIVKPVQRKDNLSNTNVNIKRKHKKDKQKAEDNVTSDVPKVTPKVFSLFDRQHKDTYINTQSGKSVSEKVFTISGNKFKDLPIHRHLVSNLEKIEFTTLTTVQEKAIPVVLTGKDVLIRSQTGSGKTLAYAVPIIDALQGITPRLQRKDGVQAIVVVPTRELALQTHELFKKINTFQWIVTGHLCGGENRKSEKDRLRKGIHLLIGTPGRLLDHVLHTSALKVENVRCLVLDEADRLLDMGFRKDIISLVEELSKSKSNSEYDPLKMLKTTQNSKYRFEDTTDEETVQPDEFPLKNVNSKNRQTILLSATLSKGVTELAEFAMNDHVSVDALDENSNDNIVDGGGVSDSLIIPDTVKQEFIVTYVKHRLFTLCALIAFKSKSKMFVFMASTQMVEFHYDLFTRYLVKMPVNRGKLKTGNVVLFDATSDNSDNENEEEEKVLNTEFFKLHGSMDQKMRKEVFTAFRAAKSGVLLCTDVAARGLDVPTADCIVQYTGPQTDEDYLHRVGRTGRAGQTGFAIIFLTHEEQDYISHLKEQRVFLKQRNPENYLSSLCEVMQEPDHERAAEALQRRFEIAIIKDKSLHQSACFAFSTWSRFYNSYPSKMRTIFDFKKINLGHYATSFALRDTPSQISKVVRGEVSNTKVPRLNKKLANHEMNVTTTQKPKQKRSISLLTSEYSSGLEPVKKKKKNQQSE